MGGLGWEGSARQSKQHTPRSDMARAWLAQLSEGLCGCRGRGEQLGRRQSRRVRRACGPW